MARKTPFTNLLTVQQASRHAKIKPNTLRAAARLGAIKHFRPSGPRGAMFFMREDLDAYVDKMRGVA